MNPLAALITIICIILILGAPKKQCLGALFFGCCYITKGQGLDLGPISLPVYRLLLLASITRVLAQGHLSSIRLINTDKVVIAWGLWGIIASFGHDWSIGLTPIGAMGISYDLVLFYFVIRALIDSQETFEDTLSFIAWLLLPIALVMIIETFVYRNPFSFFGGVSEVTKIRDGRPRAQGPFMHPILAGTVGAANFPLFVALLSKRKIPAIVGISSSLCMVITSSSSGPLLTAVASGFALMLWKRQNLLAIIQKISIPGLVALTIVTGRNPVYLINYLNVIGGSTGWHRAFLVDQTMKHFSEWWLVGTDRTRHWMPGQGRISDYHTDITNYFITFAVNGGLLGLLLILAVYFFSFKNVGSSLKIQGVDNQDKFLFWALGSSLFAHTFSGLSVSYFDQSVIFLWMVVACISSLYAQRSSLSVSSEPFFHPSAPSPNIHDSGHRSY